MLNRILTTALFAGAAAGLITTLLQLAFVQPVLLHAELYESGQLLHNPGTPVSSVQTHLEIDLLRDGLSLLFTMLTYTGYAFILIAMMVLAETQGAVINARNGLIWGVAGFITFHMAPGFGLAPEVPGVSAASVEARQIWWFATALATAAALWIIAFHRGKLLWLLAVALLLAPHLIGAPAPESYAGTVPPELSSLFAARAFGVGLAAWVLLGLFAGYFWQAENRHDETSE